MFRTTICCSLAVAIIVQPEAVRAVRQQVPSPAPVLGIEPRPRFYFPLATVWSAELPSAPTGAPAFDAATAYIAMTNGTLTAIALADAKPRWTVDAIAAGDLAGGDAAVFVPGFGAIEARSTADGSLKWRTETGTKISGPMVWDTSWLVAGTELGDLLVMRTADGSIVWRTSLENARLRNRPALAADRLYVPLDDGRVVAYELATGKTVWTTTFGDAASDVLALDDRLFVGSKDNFFYCLDAATGDRKWRQRTGADVVGTPVVDRTQVFFVSLDNVLRSLDRGGGTLKWRQPLPIRPPAGPILVDDMLLISGMSVNIRGFLTKEGRSVGDYGAPAELVSRPYYLAQVPGLTAQPLLVLLLIDEKTPRLEVMTPELPVI